MAKVIGPLSSFDARGKVGPLVFAVWRGISYVRQHFIPANPQTTEQTNMRLALTLMVAEWQAQLGPEMLLWDAAAKGQPYSGFNLFMKNGLDEYISQLTVSVTPVSVAYTPPYPGSWVWA